MKNIKRFFILWMPVLTWCLLIFYGSSISSPQPTRDPLVDFVLHKLFHLFEYGMLFILVHRATKNFSLALLYVIFYAFSDEIHQSFVVTREATLRDVLIDFIGGLIGWRYVLQTRPKKRKK